MKLDRKSCGWTIGAALTLAVATQAFTAETAFKNLRTYFTSGSITANPGIMVIVGVGLITLRWVIAKRSKRREKGTAHS